MLAGQLARFATSNRHQLAGQAANLDFWLGEVRHCLSVIDGYRPRFERLRTAHTSYVKAHQVMEFDPRDEEGCLSCAAPPRQIPGAELNKARNSLCDATYRFLVRCHNEGFITEPVLRDTCSSLGIVIDDVDLHPRA